MRILMVSTELVPVAKVGGLADMVGSLARALVGLGHDVRCALPRYRSVDDNLPADPTVGPWDGGATGGTWSAARPPYLRDIRGETNVENRSVNMGARTINGSKWDPDVPNFSIPAGAVQELTIKGATQHPYHQHVYHLQMNGACGAFEDGEYYDTIAGSCTARFDLSEASSVYDGRTVMHCHILSHEDQGAMGWMDIYGNGALGPPAFPDPDNQQALYACGDICTATEDPEISCTDGVDTSVANARSRHRIAGIGDAPGCVGVCRGRVAGDSNRRRCNLVTRLRIGVALHGTVVHREQPAQSVDNGGWPCAVVAADAQLRLGCVVL